MGTIPTAAVIARAQLRTLASVRVGLELRLRTADARIIYGRITAVEAELVAILPFGCLEPLRVERAALRHADAPDLGTYARWRACCARQRAGIFVAPSAAE